jgi:hypothetical protein
MIEYTLEDSVGLCGSPLSASPNVITLNGNTLDHSGLSRDSIWPSPSRVFTTVSKGEDELKMLKNLPVLIKQLICVM